MTNRPDPSHVYLSTGCLHNNHGHCVNDHTVSGIPKKPHTCKFCAAECLCPCHRGIDVSAMTGTEIREQVIKTFVESVVGQDDNVDFEAVEEILFVLSNVLYRAGNPGSTEPVPDPVDGAIDYANDIASYLRDML